MAVSGGRNSSGEERRGAGKVLTATRKTYSVAVERQVIQCTMRGKLAVDDGYDTVRVGDNVKVTWQEDGPGVIEEILPRTSKLSRSIESRAYQEHIIAVNISQLLIIMSTRRPRFKSGLLDRYLVIAEKNQLHPLICINKVDLAPSKQFRHFQEYYEKLNYPVLFTSAVSGEGITDLAEALSEGVTALVGFSGVGKSTLINAIEPGLDIRVGDVSERTLKGQHTTTSAEMFPLSSGGFVVDTPGIRELGFWGIYKKDLQHYFIELKHYAPRCQFADCTHIHEPGCAVKMAVQAGDILAERYENYVNIYDSLKSAAYEYRISRT